MFIEEDVCGYLCVHEEQVRRVQEHLPSEDTLYQLSELYRMFGNETRLKILCALLEGECCVCDLAKLLNMTISAISHQLRLLRQARLIRNRREGQTNFYSLNDDHVATLLRQGMEHISE